MVNVHQRVLLLVGLKISVRSFLLYLDMSGEDYPPVDPASPADEEPVPSPPADPVLDFPDHFDEAFQVMSAQIQALEKAQDDMKKMFLHQLILVS